VIVAENSDMRTLGAFIVPNEPISSKKSLKNYEVALAELEETTGLNFLAKLDRGTARNLCKVEGCKLSNKEELDLFYIQKRILGAKDQAALDKAWSVLSRKNYKPTKQLQDAYNGKMRSFREL
jgi:hypothetical protein